MRSRYAPLRIGKAQWILVPLLLIGIGLIGCASSHTAQEVDERVRALGTWEYRSQGIRELQRGTLHIMTRDGDLIGRFRDQWRGKFEAQVRLEGSRMAILLDRFRITGQITNGQFTGTVRETPWDVTRQNGRRRSSGQFEARRIRHRAVSTENDRFGCPSLLRETSYACSPLRSL